MKTPLIVLTALLLTQIAFAEPEVGTYGVYTPNGWVALESIPGNSRPTHTTDGIEFIAGYDYYLEPNNNNYTDAQGFHLGIEHPIYKQLRGVLEFSHMADVKFPEPRDPKGAWGELQGFGGIYSLKMDFPITRKLSVFLKAGAGYYDWDFKEYPFLQDEHVTVNVEPAFMWKAGGGIEWKPVDGWTVGANVGWLDTSIEKDIPANDAGIVHILDAKNINLRYTYTGVETKYEF